MVQNSFAKSLVFLILSTIKFFLNFLLDFQLRTMKKIVHQTLQNYSRGLVDMKDSLIKVTTVLTVWCAQLFQENLPQSSVKF